MGSKQKQTARWVKRRVRLNAARLEAWRQARNRARAPSALARRQIGWRSRLGLLIAIPLMLFMVIWLGWSQVQIGRVLLLSEQTEGTVIAVSQCSRATAGDVTVVFTDARDTRHRVRHSSFTLGCSATYYVGEAVALRYVPSDPTVLVTEPEIADLWRSLLVLGLLDYLFLGAGAVVFFVIIMPWTSSRLSALRAKASR